MCHRRYYASRVASYRGSIHRTLPFLLRLVRNSPCAAKRIPNEPLQVIARLWWTTAEGKRSGAPDYPYAVSREGEWTRLSLDAQAPDKTAEVTIHLYLANAPQGTLWWDDVSFDEIPAPGPRPVTIATIHLRPRDTVDSEE